MRGLYTLILIVTHSSNLSVTVTPGMTKKGCADANAAVQTASGVDGLRAYGWCVKTSSASVDVSELPGMTDPK